MLLLFRTAPLPPSWRSLRTNPAKRPNIYDGCFLAGCLSSGWLSLTSGQKMLKSFLNPLQGVCRVMLGGLGLIAHVHNDYMNIYISWYYLFPKKNTHLALNFFSMTRVLWNSGLVITCHFCHELWKLNLPVSFTWKTFQPIRTMNAGLSNRIIPNWPQPKRAPREPQTSTSAKLPHQTEGRISNAV